MGVPKVRPSGESPERISTWSSSFLGVVMRDCPGFRRSSSEVVMRRRRRINKIERRARSNEDREKEKEKEQEKEKTCVCGGTQPLFTLNTYSDAGRLLYYF